MHNDDEKPPNRAAAKSAAAKIGFAAAGLAALALAGAFSVRAIAGRAFDDAAAQWRADLTAQGATVAMTIDGGVLDGFPFTLRRRLTGVEIAAAAGRATADDGEISYSLLRPDEATAIFRNVSAQSADGGRSTAQTARLTMDLTLRPLNGGGALPRAAALQLDGAAAFDGWRAQTASVDWRFPDAAPADYTQPGLIFTVAAQGVTPPPAWAGLAGGADAKGELGFAAAVKGAPPAPRPDPLEAWRVGGGVVELTQLRAVFASLQADGDATLALDRDLQMIGAGALRLIGADAALAHAAETVQRQGGPFKPKEVRQVRQIAMMLTQPDPDGGPPRLTLPFSAQNGRLFLGPFQIAKLPPPPWRRPPV